MGFGNRPLWYYTAAKAYDRTTVPPVLLNMVAFFPLIGALAAVRPVKV